MNCPACSSAFERLKNEELEIDRCTICRSLWIDATDAARPGPDEATSQDEPELGGASRLTCPRCDATPMQALRRRGVELLRCPACAGAYLSASSVRELRAQEPDPHAGYATPELEVQTLLALVGGLF